MASEDKPDTPVAPTTKPARPTLAPAGTEKEHPLSKVSSKFREASQLSKGRGASEGGELQRVGEVLRKLAECCEDCASYSKARGAGFDDKPLGGKGEYTDKAVETMRAEFKTLLDKARQDVQTNASLLTVQRGTRPAAISPELELLLRQLISALISRLFGEMRFEGEEVDARAARIVTKPQPRTKQPGTREVRNLTRR